MQNELVAPHKVDRSTEHYAAIKAEMAKRGECVIRALWSDELGYWFAIEGSHRCAAAKELGIEIQIHDIGSDDESEWVTDLDGCDVARDWEWLTDYLVSYQLSRRGCGCSRHGKSANVRQRQRLKLLSLSRFRDRRQ